MSKLEDFQKAVTEAGAIATRIERAPDGKERLIVQTPGGLVKKDVLLKGDLVKDIESAKAAATGIVATAEKITSQRPATHLSASASGKYTIV